LAGPPACTTFSRPTCTPCGRTAATRPSFRIAARYRPKLDKVRARLEKLLAEARAARTMPWEPSQLSLYRLIFPQMTLWLPEDEARQYRLAFEAEIERLAPSA
jgi:hypothetical protein